MPDLQPIQPAASMPLVVEVTLPVDDDYAFGCECADPSLQIERWQELAGGEPN